MFFQAYAKTGDANNEFYSSQKKTMEINPRHPLVKELLLRIENDEEDVAATELAMVLYETASLRSGYTLRDMTAFSERVEKMMRRSLGVSLDEQVCLTAMDRGCLTLFFMHVCLCGLSLRPTVLDKCCGGRVSGRGGRRRRRVCG